MVESGRGWGGGRKGEDRSVLRDLSDGVESTPIGICGLFKEKFV